MILRNVFTIVLACICPLGVFANPNLVNPALTLELTIQPIESSGDSSMSPIFEVEGIFINVNTKNPVEGVEVTITNKRNNHYQIRMTGSDGKFRFALHDESVYAIAGSKARYFDSEQVNISTIGRKKYEKMDMKMPIERMQLNHPYIIKELVFGVNDWELSHEAEQSLKNLQKMLLSNPTIKIEVGVHTDSRGDDDYNLHLTEKRAITILNKLRQMGIRGNRVTTKGYGETKLLNHCGNDIRCNSPEHMQNRRVSFKILSF
ncbi:MAG: OmpA family protein [Flammeovirgaceae bacterium]